MRCGRTSVHASAVRPAVTGPDAASAQTILVRVGFHGWERRTPYGTRGYYLPGYRVSRFATLLGGPTGTAR
jgi:hypothetical protein